MQGTLSKCSMLPFQFQYPAARNQKAPVPTLALRSNLVTNVTKHFEDWPHSQGVTNPARL